VFQTGSTTNNAINISGSGDKTDFSVAVSNNRTVSPVLKNGYVDRTNLSVNVGTELFKGFTFRSTTQLVYTKNTMHPGLGGAGGNNYGYGNSQGNVSNIYGFLNTSPFFDLTAKGSDGNYQAHTQGGSFLGINGLNPYYYQQYTEGLDNKTDIVQSFNANYKINRFVELDAKYGINYRDETATWTYYNQSQNINAAHWPTGSNYYAYYNNRSNKNGEIDYFHYTNTFQNFLGTAFIYTDFKNDFHSNLPIETSTQISFDYRKRKYTEVGLYGSDLDINPPFNLVNAGALSMIGPASSSAATAPLGPTSTGSYVEPFVTYGYLINQKINYGDIGGITAGFRSDWSSAFGEGSKPFTFPHADGFISASSFWKNSKLQEILPYFKLRAAYGEAGIQPGAFSRIPVLSGGPIGNETSYSIRQVPNNPHLQVEVSKEFETGFDFTVNTNTNGNWFQSVNGSFTYWKRQSPPPNMLIFDAPTREYCVVRRPRTNTPLQALVTLNDPQFVEAARQLAERAMKSVKSFDGRLDNVTEWLLARRMTSQERPVVRRLLDKSLATYATDRPAAQALIGVGESKADQVLPPAELAAWTLVASEIMNLDESLTK